MKTSGVGGWGLAAGFLSWVLAFAPLSAQTALPVEITAQQRADSLNAVRHADSLAARGGTTRSDTTLIIKHHFNHRQQIITGSVIMACMATMIVVMNNYNPQGLNQ